MCIAEQGTYPEVLVNASLLSRPYRLGGGWVLSTITLEKYYQKCHCSPTVHVPTHEQRLFPTSKQDNLCGIADAAMLTTLECTSHSTAQR